MKSWENPQLLLPGTVVLETLFCSVLSFVIPACFEATTSTEKQELLLCGRRGTAPGRLEFSTSPSARGKHALKVQRTGRETEETTYFSLSEPLLWCCRLCLLLFLGKGQKCLFICLQWFVGALLSPACRVICKQAAPLGSTNVFFLKP